ncbi:MAG: hypothetical protein NC910_00595 [Candidatus Omnitrophica bacterium]|nr:hypothetical protein [Candidatus Omnitrophota bacterium]
MRGVRLFLMVSVFLCFAHGFAIVASVEPARAELKQSSFEEPLYTASVAANRYHLSTCDLVKKISKGDRVGFQTLEAAEERGFKECPICRPREQLAREIAGIKSVGPSRSERKVATGGTRPLPMRPEPTPPPIPQDMGDDKPVSTPDFVD